MDFHGNQGNIGGDGPAASRYTESRLMKLAEDGMLNGLKKRNVDFIPNYDETTKEPVTLPSIFPNLLCNPNTGIGVAMACNWLPHNLNEVAEAINKYIDGETIEYLAPDFPTGGLIINEKDIPKIVKTGRGSIKVRGKYNVSGQKIIFYEIPYGLTLEGLIDEIGEVAEKGDVEGIKDIHDESNKKGLRLVIECSRGNDPEFVVKKLFAKTKLQTSISYNQVALVNKTPTELNLEKCLEIYVKHNTTCIEREARFDLEKALARLEIVNGLLKALEDIDNIIALIKSSDSSKDAKEKLITKYNFTENQAKAILDMKLAKLAKLESIELNQEKTDLNNKIEELDALVNNYNLQIVELRKRLDAIVKKYGDERRTELTNITIKKEEKEKEDVVPEDVVVVLTEDNAIKRIPKSSFKTQKRNGVGVKTEGDVVKFTCSTNTIDNILLFSNKGQMYRILVDKIPVGTNISRGQNLHALLPLDNNEMIVTAMSLNADCHEKHIIFVTKNGLIKKTLLSEYLSVKKNKGIAAIKLKSEDDEIVSVFTSNDSDLAMVFTKNGKTIKFNIDEVTATGRVSAGVKSINLKDGDIVVSALIVKDSDILMIAGTSGHGKRILVSEFNTQKRGGVGVTSYPAIIAKVVKVEDSDKILVIGNSSTLCANVNEVPIMGRVATGVKILKNGEIKNILVL